MVGSAVTMGKRTLEGVVKGMGNIKYLYKVNAFSYLIQFSLFTKSITVTKCSQKDHHGALHHMKMNAHTYLQAHLHTYTCTHLHEPK